MNVELKEALRAEYPDDAELARVLAQYIFNHFNDTPREEVEESRIKALVDYIEGVVPDYNELQFEWGDVTHKGGKKSDQFIIYILHRTSRIGARVKLPRGTAPGDNAVAVKTLKRKIAQWEIQYDRHLYADIDDAFLSHDISMLSLRNHGSSLILEYNLVGPIYQALVTMSMVADDGAHMIRPQEVMTENQLEDRIEFYKDDYIGKSADAIAEVARTMMSHLVDKGTVFHSSGIERIDQDLTNLVLHGYLEVDADYGYRVSVTLSVPKNDWRLIQRLKTLSIHGESLA